MRAAALLLLLASCSGTPLSPTEPAPVSDVVRSEWAIAQAKIGGLASTIGPERFAWIEHVGMFPCGAGGPMRQGCFHTDAPGPRIEWDVTAPSIIRHEAGHSILWALGDSRFECYEHDDPTNGNYEPRCAR